MSDFTASSVVGTPTWTGVTAPATDFTALSSTGQVQITQGGYGLGGYGEGGYGEGESTTVSINTTLNTTWTAFTTR